MLLGARSSFLASAARLPYDAEVEYLESTGTQWIDTEVKKTSGMTIDCTFSLSATNTKAIFGARTSPSALDRLMLMAIGSYFRFDANRQPSLGTPDTTSMFHFQYDGANATMTNLTTGTTDTADTTVGNAGVFNITLFGVNTNGVVGSLMLGRMYAFKLWDNGVLVRDYIPVRKGTVGYLYDRVSGQLFGNAGTGDFVVGPDVVPVEWLGFTGTQYINTGFAITNATSFAYEVKYDLAETITNAQPRIISNEGAGAEAFYDIYYVVQYDQIYVRRSGNVIRNPVKNKPIVSVMTEQGRYYGYYEESPQSLLYDATSTFVAPTTVQQYTIGTRANSYQDQYKHEGRIYYALFTKDGSPAKKFYAVRVGNEGAMMDTLTRRIYRNAGTGSFSYGNDLPYPIG